MSSGSTYTWSILLDGLEIEKLGSKDVEVGLSNERKRRQTPSAFAPRSKMTREPRSKARLHVDDELDSKADLPSPIKLTSGQRIRRNTTIPFRVLIKQKYYVDKTDLIMKLYEEEAKGLFLCLPRQTGKTTVIDSFIQWTVHHSRTRTSRLSMFENSKLMSLVRNNNSPSINQSTSLSPTEINDGTVGFNQHLIIFADFYGIETIDMTELKQRVVKAFLNYLCEVYRDKFDRNTVNEFLEKDPRDILFFKEIIFRIAGSSNDAKTAIVIIDNFDAPVLSILNRTRSTEKAKEVMRFFNEMMHIVEAMPTSEPTGIIKVILTGSHYPVDMRFSHLARFRVDWYPYSLYDYCKMFFFSEEEVNTLMSRYNDNTTIQALSERYGKYRIDSEEYFHPGNIISYFLCQRKYDSMYSDTVFWYTTDLDILTTASGIENFEMLVWLLKPNQMITFEYQEVLDFESIRSDKNHAFTYLLQAGYLTEVKAKSDQQLAGYGITNLEVRNILYSRYREWAKIGTPSPDPFSHFTATPTNYREFFRETNEILKRNYTDDDLKYEGNYHVYLASFFHLKKGWIFTSNYPAGFGRYDFIVYDESETVDTGYLFEIAHIKGASSDVNLNAVQINELMEEKWRQVLRNKYYIEVPKRVKHCVIVVGCKKKMHFRVYEI